jgi:hypothetical protein
MKRDSLFLALGSAVAVTAAVACGGSSSSFSSGTGGSSGSAGASAMTGGSCGSGGSDGGSSGSMSGSGGSSGMSGYHPPESQVDACTRLCQREAEAMCENDPPLAKCIGDCRVAILFEDCSDEWDELFECTDDADVECGDSDEAELVGCLGPYASALACVFDEGLDTDYQEPCSAFCEQASEPDCENAGSRADCTQGCVVIASAFPVCNDRYDDHLACGADATFTCNDAEEAEASGCAAETLLFFACVLGEYDIEP